MDLKPCPFCGETEAVMEEHMDGTILHPAFRVVCDNCGASSRYTDKDHVACWNIRADIDTSALAALAMRDACKDAAQKVVDDYLGQGGSKYATAARYAVDAIRALPLPGDPLAAALRLPEIKAVVDAVKAEITARQKYENTPADRGGPNGLKGRRQAAWQRAIAEVFAAISALEGKQ